MTIWMICALLFALFGALGYAKGAIRMIFPLIGLMLGVFLAVPLGPIVKPLVPLVGLKNPIWSILLPPVIVFFLISLGVPCGDARSGRKIGGGCCPLTPFQP